jgi:hypothetical protein
MGASRAYGGTPGWKPVADQTQQWIQSRPQGGDGTGTAGQPDVSLPSNVEGQPDSPLAGTFAGPSMPAQLSRLLRSLGRKLASDGSGGTSGATGGGGRAGSGGRGRSASQASTVGGRAVAGAYGLRTGAAGPLTELGLTLTELTGLPKHQQAQRIVDAALGPSGAINQSELRQVNFEVVLWALKQEVEPSPIELADRWVVEYVWEAWITESGSRIRDLAANGRDRLIIEQEMRAGLEAVVSAHGLPTDRPLTSADFQTAIQGALSALGRITRVAA